MTHYLGRRSNYSVKEEAFKTGYQPCCSHLQIEPSKYDGRPKITCRECDSADSALHMRYSTFTLVEGDGLDSTSCTACCDSMSKFMESNDKHLSQRLSDSLNGKWVEFLLIAHFERP